MYPKFKYFKLLTIYSNLRTICKLNNYENTSLLYKGINDTSLFLILFVQFHFVLLNLSSINLFFFKEKYAYSITSLLYKDTELISHPNKKQFVM